MELIPALHFCGHLRAHTYAVFLKVVRFHAGMLMITRRRRKCTAGSEPKRYYHQGWGFAKVQMPAEMCLQYENPDVKTLSLVNCRSPQ